MVEERLNEIVFSGENALLRDNSVIAKNLMESDDTKESRGNLVGSKSDVTGGILK